MPVIYAEYFLHKVDVAAVTRNSFALIYYTGKRDLCLPHNLPVNFLIFRTRPRLEETISGIIDAIHSGGGLPEEMCKLQSACISIRLSTFNGLMLSFPHTVEHQKALSNIPFSKRVQIALARVATTYSRKDMFDFAVQETEAHELEAMRLPDDLESASDRKTTSSEKSDHTHKVSDHSNLKANAPNSNAGAHLTKKASGEYNRRDALPTVRSSRTALNLRDNRTTLKPITKKEELISIKGLESMIRKFLGGIGEYSQDDIQAIFKQIDEDNSGLIDESEFSKFLLYATRAELRNDEAALRMSKVMEEGKSNLIARQMQRRGSFNSATHSVLSSTRDLNEPVTVGDDETIKYMEALVDDPDKPLDDWSLFYCGGSRAIKNTLRGIERKYKVRSNYCISHVTVLIFLLTTSFNF